jgi:hypothetical protein
LVTWNRVLKKLIDVELIRKFPGIYGALKVIAVHESLPLTASSVS